MDADRARALADRLMARLEALVIGEGAGPDPNHLNPAHPNPAHPNPAHKAELDHIKAALGALTGFVRLGVEIERLQRARADTRAAEARAKAQEIKVRTLASGTLAARTLAIAATDPTEEDEMNERDRGADELDPRDLAQLRQDIEERFAELAERLEQKGLLQPILRTGIADDRGFLVHPKDRTADAAV